jgi:hypothetical protein
MIADEYGLLAAHHKWDHAFWPRQHGQSRRCCTHPVPQLGLPRR